MSRFFRHLFWFSRNTLGALLLTGTGCSILDQPDSPHSPSAAGVPIPPPIPIQAAQPAPAAVTIPAAAATASPNRPQIQVVADSAAGWQRIETASAQVVDAKKEPPSVAADKAPPKGVDVLPVPKSLANAPTELPAAATHKLAIDLPYALRQCDSTNPTIAAAVERINQALSVQLAAKAAFLPDIWVGGNPDNYTFLPTYYQHSGVLQNAAGNVFGVNKSNVELPAGASINYKLSDVIFAPFIARDTTAAAQARARVIRYSVQLDTALTYLDLLRVYGALAINAETLAHAEQMLGFAKQAIDNGLGKTTADANRARTEVDIRKQERLDLEGQAVVTSARLAQLLLLQPSVDLAPADPRVVPLTLVSSAPQIEDLIAVGLMNRPELAESRALVAAAYKRWQQDRTRPFLPTLSVVFYGANFGGSSNAFGYKNGGREDFMAQAAWELKNLGVGDIARTRGSRSQYNEANFHTIEVEAQVAADVTAAAKLSALHERNLKNAEGAVQQGEEMWTRLLKAAFGMVGGAQRYDPLEPLIAEQQLDRARMMYLDEVIAYNRSQFQLYWAMGQPPLSALPQAVSLPLETSVLPTKEEQSKAPEKK